MIKGVMFDFSGTLLHIESTEDWLAGALAAVGRGLDGPEFTALASRLDAVGALPGGPHDVPMTPEMTVLWERRDLTPADHRACYVALARSADLPFPGLDEALYRRAQSPDGWRPYPDARPVLRELRARDVPVAVVSNIGWDLRPVFARFGLDAFVDVFVLSYELEIQKPDPRIFRYACDELGLDPASVLMVGDDRTADGGAAALGCTVRFVDSLPVTDRPDALRPVLDLV